MSTADITQLLTDLDPQELRERIAELDRQRSALAVLLRAAAARQLGRTQRHKATPLAEEVRHGN